MAKQMGTKRGFTGGLEAPATRLATQLAAGPFDPARGESDAMPMRDALLTGLLVIYPVFATVAVIAIGLFLSAPLA
ncbi:MAG: hypothetical protein KF810_22860 [Rhizobiaceae bacterium]|nr:hypothetical protein [Rhizobiaceae bacterium]